MLSHIKRIFLFAFLLYWLVPIGAQQTVSLDLLHAESKLADLFKTFYTDTVAERDSLLTEIQTTMEEALVLEGAMEFPFSRLDRIGKIAPHDGRFRVFSWHMETAPGSYNYYAYFQVAQRKGKVKLIRLEDNGRPQRNIFHTSQSAKDWYGKLYYQVVAHKYRRKTYYTLFGMDFNDHLSHIKTMEVITLQRRQPAFTTGRLLKQGVEADRFVLEYSDHVSVSLRYDASLELVVFDHLIPDDPQHPEKLESYGPDGSYDGFTFIKGHWVYQEDIDARNLN